MQDLSGTCTENEDFGLALEVFGSYIDNEDWILTSELVLVFVCHSRSRIQSSIHKIFLKCNCFSNQYSFLHEK